MAAVPCRIITVGRADDNDSDDDWMGDAAPARGKPKPELKKSPSANSNADDWLGDFEGARKRVTTKPAESTSEAGKSPVPRRSLFLSIARHLKIKSSL